MGTSLIDTSTKASLELVKNLAKKLNYFINGMGIMQTDSGPVESIGAIAKRLSSTGYFHPIQVFDTYVAMTLAGLVEDDMGYVNGDPDPKKRGLFQVQQNGEFKKQSYESIVALSRELGRELLVQDVPVTAVTGPVEIYKMVIPVDVEQTVWLDLKLKSIVPATGMGGVQDITLFVRVNQNATVQVGQLTRETTASSGQSGTLPLLDYTITTQNQGSVDENRLVTIRVKPQVDNVSLATLSVVDSSSLIYKA